MVDEKIKGLLLSKRILRSDPFEDVTWVNEYFTQWIDNLGIPNTDIFSCNTLQRNCTCTIVKGRQIILFDNYNLELFVIFNQMLEPETDTRQIEALFCQIIRNVYFSLDNIKYAAIYWRLAAQKTGSSKMVRIRQVTRYSEPRYIYTQQAFVVAHELMHSWFKESPDELKYQVEIIDDILREIFADRYSDIISKFSLSNKEEFCCDHIAVYLAMDVSVNSYHNFIENSAAAILLALCHQFVLFCIDKWAAGQLEPAITNVDNFRMTIVRCYIRNYVKQYSPDKQSSVNRILDDVYRSWKEKILATLTKFLIEQNQNQFYYEKIHIGYDDICALKEKLRLLL